MALPPIGSGTLPESGERRTALELDDYDGKLNDA